MSTSVTETMLRGYLTVTLPHKEWTIRREGTNGQWEIEIDVPLQAVETECPYLDVQNVWRDGETLVYVCTLRKVPRTRR